MPRAYVSGDDDKRCFSRRRGEEPGTGFPDTHDNQP
jgi:hypothetical protein